MNTARHDGGAGAKVTFLPQPRSSCAVTGFDLGTGISVTPPRLHSSAAFAAACASKLGIKWQGVVDGRSVSADAR
jgi:hypothetical protein